MLASGKGTIIIIYIKKLTNYHINIIIIKTIIDEALSPVSSPQKDTIFGSPSFRYPISDFQLTESIYENENPNNSNNSQNMNHVEESLMTVESDI